MIGLLLCLFGVVIGDDTLLFVYDISSHGSKYPVTNVAGLEDPATFKFLQGTLTEFGKRQMVLRGMEMRQRLALNSSFMSASVNN